MSDMNEYARIKEIGKVITGKTPSTENEENFDGEFPFITPSDISTFDEKYIVETERTISSKGYKKMKNNLLPMNTICFVCIGSTIGKMCLTKKPSFTNQQINALIVNENYDAQYVFYLLRYVKGYFQQIGAGTGSGKGIVNKSTFEKSRICVEKKLLTQKEISSILSAYDDLIENNNKRIKILEQMAENLYKEWFVRFRFPGYENALVKDSLLGKIPQSFNVLKMKHIIDYYIGGGWGEDEQKQGFPCGAYVIRGTDFSNIKNGEWMQCPYRYHKKSNYMARKLSPWDIIIEISGGTQEQPVGRTLIVTPDLLEKLGDTVICASFCKQVRCNNEIISPSYFYYWMQYLYQTRVIDKFQSQTTGIINFKFEYFLRKGDVLMPPKDLMDKFEKYIKTIYKMKDKLAIKNQNLIKQRDLLLPRLMSGKLEVGGERKHHYKNCQ